MALFVLAFAECCGRLSALAWRDAWRNALSLKGRAIFITVIAFVSDQHGAGNCLESRIEDFGTHMIGDLTSRQAHRHQTAFAIANCMEFCVQATLCTANVAGKNPPFRRLDAVR